MVKTLSKCTYSRKISSSNLREHTSKPSPKVGPTPVFAGVQSAGGQEKILSAFLLGVLCYCYCYYYYRHTHPSSDISGPWMREDALGRGKVECPSFKS